jgi:uncharacterized cupredoxin-like copper-binding protein
MFARGQLTGNTSATPPEHVKEVGSALHYPRHWIERKENTMRYRLVSLFGLLTFCAFLAACGGSTSTPATTTLAAPTAAAASAPAALAPTATTTAPAAATATTAPATTTAVSAAPTVPAASAPAPSAASATTAPAAAGSTVAVELKDFAIMLDTSTVNAGMVTFNVKNSGPSPHNFNVKVNGEEKGIATLDPGKTATLTLNLPAGAYDFRCNIPGHDLLGMKGTLTVK